MLVHPYTHTTLISPLSPFDFLSQISHIWTSVAGGQKKDIFETWAWITYRWFPFFFFTPLSSCKSSSSSLTRGNSMNLCLVAPVKWRKENINNHVNNSTADTGHPTTTATPCSESARRVHFAHRRRRHQECLDSSAQRTPVQLPGGWLQQERREPIIKTAKPVSILLLLLLLPCAAKGVSLGLNVLSASQHLSSAPTCVWNSFWPWLHLMTCLAAGCPEREREKIGYT